MPVIKDIINCIEGFAPLFYQESYDNSGLQIGNDQQAVTGVLLSVDVTEEVIDEAKALGANMVISHHPMIFGGLKRIIGINYTERAIIKAIKADIAVYSCHTNIDNIFAGVSFKMAEKLGLSDIKVLKPLEGNLYKLATFVPLGHMDKVRSAILEAGAGHIGNYDFCSFNVQGEGTFRASEKATPFIGEKGAIHTEPEVRIETIFPKHLENRVIFALKNAHPYEEVAYDIYPLDNHFSKAGAGAIGHFNGPMGEKIFLDLLKSVFKVSMVRHSPYVGKGILNVALCGGSGSFLLGDAKKAGAEVFISADFKYHQFFEADNRIMIADIGHFESEQFTLEIFYDLLIKNFSNFAVHFTKVKTNPINYY